MFDWFRKIFCFGKYNRMCKCVEIRKFDNCKFKHQCNNSEIAYRFKYNIPHNTERYRKC